MTDEQPDFCDVCGSEEFACHAFVVRGSAAWICRKCLQDAVKGMRFSLKEHEAAQ